MIATYVGCLAQFLGAIAFVVACFSMMNDSKSLVAGPLILFAVSCGFTAYVCAKIAA